MKTPRSPRSVKQSLTVLTDAKPHERATVRDFALLKRVGSAIDRKLKPLRNPVEIMFEQPGRTISPKSRGTEIEYLISGQGPFVVKCTNTAYDKRVLNQEKALAVLRRHKIPVSACTGPNPAATAGPESLQPKLPEYDAGEFSQAKFKALIQKKKITQKDYDSCFDAYAAQDLLANLGIDESTCIVKSGHSKFEEPIALGPPIDAKLFEALYQQHGKITRKEYDDCQELAPLRTRIDVEVPKIIDDKISEVVANIFNIIESFAKNPKPDTNGLKYPLTRSQANAMIQVQPEEDEVLDDD